MGKLFQRIRELLPVQTIDRYMMKHYMIAWGICAFAVFGLFSVIDGVSRLDRFLRKDDPLPLVVIKYFAGMIPIYFTQYLGPILTLLAAMFTTTQLNKGSELVPLRAAGLPLSRILASFFLIAFLMTLSMIFVQEFIVPSFKDQIRLADSYGRARASIQPEMVADSRNNLIQVLNYLPHEKRGQDVEITTKHAGLATSSKITRAREILWKNPKDGDPYWLLLNGTVEQFDKIGMKIPIPASDGSIQLSQGFSELKLTTDMRPVDLESSDREIEYLSFTELRDQYKRRPHLKHLEVKLHRRFAFPLANFILLMLGLPFILKTESRSIILGITIAMALGTTYLIVTEVCANLGTRGALNPMLAAWLPVLFFGSLGLTLFDGIED
ncbi:MAG: LptF/LptG family permease [Planctomycetota bacterium]